MPAAIVKRTILVADDDPGHLRLMELVLDAHEYLVVGVENGAEAMEYLDENTPDLAILDVQMPFATGLEVCARARSDHRLKDLPIIIMTAMTDDRIERRATEAGASLVLHKPLTGEAIRGVIREILATSA